MRWRFLLFYLGLIFGFWLLAFRLLELTVIEGGYYRQLSEGNRTLEENIVAPRGIIYDRHHQVLARNVPVYKKCLLPTTVGTSPSACQSISRQEALALEAKGGEKNFSLVTDLGREYPWGKVLAHTVGYIGEVTEEEIKTDDKWRIGDWRGRTGIEEGFDKSLRGLDGKRLSEIDAKGEKLKTLGQIEPKPGQDLVASLDLDLQKKAAEAMGEGKGAVIASNPSTGEIFALYSLPSFDPNTLNEKTLSLGGEPFFNRAIAGLYPPGSVFKIITAIAGLETGKINRQTQVEDVGEIVIGPYKFPNWYWSQHGGKEGPLDIVRAMRRSNDIFFYKVGEWVGIDKLADYGGKLGVGRILGLDIPGEVAGVMPTPDWVEKARGEKWFLGDTYHVAIGQGDLQVTPLQVNFWTNIIANSGKLCQPTLVKRNPSDSKGQGSCQDLGLKKETIELIKEAMRQACSPGGTGWPLFNFEVKTAEGKARIVKTGCKTGTAEFGPSTGSGQGRTHAWFTVFAPVEDPEISVTVLVEAGGEGSNVAAPIAKEILEEWFSR
jgi:penicillin-binding protein 2